MGITTLTGSPQQVLTGHPFGVHFLLLAPSVGTHYVRTHGY